MPKPKLPPEIVDFIIDFLHNDQKALEQCCLASKPWVPRTRKYLFNSVSFRHPRQIDSWKENFSDPRNSPAIYTRYLCFRRAEWVTRADVSWIRSFDKVERLDLRSSWTVDEPSRPGGSFSPFHDFSLTVKSLSVSWSDLPLWEVFDLISSFPLLEDLDVAGLGQINDGDGAISRFPVLTGTLVLEPTTADFVRRLLELPTGLLLRKIVWREGLENEFEGVRDLVERCSETLECVDLTCLGQIDLSRATKLKEVGFELNEPCAERVAATLDTITLKHEDFEQVSVYFPFLFLSDGTRPVDIRRAVGEEMHSQWVQLDRILVRLWESHSIRLKVICNVNEKGEKVALEGMKYLLREMAAKGKIELELDVLYS